MQIRASGVVYSLLLSSSVGNRLPVGSILIIRLCWKALLLLWRTDPGYLFSLPCYAMLTLCYAWFLWSCSVLFFYFSPLFHVKTTNHRKDQNNVMLLYLVENTCVPAPNTGVTMKNILRNNLMSFTV